MNRQELARELARLQKISDAQAADQIDSAFHRIVQRLRKGKSVKLPGLGTLQMPLASQGQARPGPARSKRKPQARSGRKRGR